MLQVKPIPCAAKFESDKLPYYQFRPKNDIMSVSLCRNTMPFSDRLPIGGKVRIKMT